MRQRLSGVLQCLDPIKQTDARSLVGIRTSKPRLAQVNGESVCILLPDSGPVRNSWRADWCSVVRMDDEVHHAVGISCDIHVNRIETVKLIDSAGIAHDSRRGRWPPGIAILLYISNGRVVAIIDEHLPEVAMSRQIGVPNEPQFPESAANCDWNRSDSYKANRVKKVQACCSGPIDQAAKFCAIG